MPLDVGQIVCCATLTPIKKKDGGLRPIATGEVVRRLTSKVLARKVLLDMRELLEPSQIGVGLPGACELAALKVEALMRDQDAEADYGLLQVDMANAYNTIDRAAMLTQVERLCPETAIWFAWSHGQRTPLLVGKEVLWSCQGVQQGDPLSPL
jgi:hypothetical protein